mgnify:FL=1
MILKHFDLRKNLKKEANFYLLYGPNIGLIEDSIESIFKPSFSKNLYHYEENEILSDERTFKEEIFNKSFFDNNKFIIINRSSDKILNLIKEIIEKKIKDLKIVLKSGVLDKKSKLRSFFEKNENTFIIPFYEDNYQTLAYLTQNFFKEKKIKISSQNINLIIERSKRNRINLKNELEKIANFTKKKLSIDLNEILKITNLAENYNISELTDQCLAKNRKKTFNILNENNPSNEDNIIILRNFLYKLKRLKKLKKNLNIEKNSDNVISEYKPPIFWKDKEIVKQQLEVWSLIQIQKSINKINEIECLIKKNSQISSLIVNNFIMESLKSTNN